MVSPRLNLSANRNMKTRKIKKQLLKHTKKGSYERYISTHCEICGEKVDIIHDDYFNKYGFCSVPCGMELYGLSEHDFYG